MGVMDGQVVIVTGGGRGIGRDVALIAAREGAKVLVNDLGGGLHGGDEGSAGPAEEVADIIRKNGGKAVSNSDSITDYDACCEMREQALKEFGALHSVINPAGILRDGMFHKMTPADWDAVIAVHLRGHFNVARATIEHFRERNEGAYVMFSSGSGLIGNIGQTNYGAAKMGIAALSRIIAMEGASKGVRSNTLAPGAQTRMTASVPIKTEEQAARRAAQRDTNTPERPAAMAVALASPLTKHISGEIFGAAGNNISLYSQPRPIATLSKDGGWSPSEIIETALPQWKDKLVGLARPPRPGEPASFLAQQQQQKAKT
ncbi:MAG TPA: SDR family NAD(P)-dependent oxidoreductase [Caulobacterales bacterium]|nr:SDR family NAD(P)-dependent oxidoreductase [Caulobacterales bacterium]